MRVFGGGQDSVDASARYATTRKVEEKRGNGARGVEISGEISERYQHDSLSSGDSRAFIVNNFISGMKKKSSLGI